MVRADARIGSPLDRQPMSILRDLIWACIAPLFGAMVKPLYSGAPEIE
jgi:hypothetical protein